MDKKNFKSNTQSIDKLFSNASNVYNNVDEYNDHYNYNNHNVVIDNKKPKYHHFNLKLTNEYKKFLEDASWRARKSVTQYLRDLIKEQMDKENNK